jgi:WD40 repeat protein
MAGPWPPGGDDTIKLWDVKTGQLRASLQGDGGVVNSVAFSNDEQTLAAVGGTIELWDVKPRK